MFAAAMDKHGPGNVTTANGRPSLATTGDARIDAFFKFVRGLSREGVERHVAAILAQAARAEDAETAADAFVLWAQTRDVRGGKGERDLARWTLVALALRYPATAVALVPLIPEFGSWRDVVSLLETEGVPMPLKKALVELYSARLSHDAKEGTDPTLAAKWAPREKSGQKPVALLLATALFPGDKAALPKYRKLISSICETLDVAERKMCAGEWADIKPGGVPARCLKIHRAAFMNEKKNRNRNRNRNKNNDEEEPALRSELEDRVQCAKNFTEHALAAAKDPKKASMHGRVLHPHEMVKEYMYSRNNKEDCILEAQWVNLRESLREEMPALGKMVPIVDVSGSMGGTPMEVAIALGVLISEVTHPVMRDRFITFHSDPMWHVLDKGWSLQRKVKSAQSARWGMNTNFQKALDLVLNACVKGDVPPEEVGELSLVVLSDMQFDRAQSSPCTCNWETQYGALKRSFNEAGLRSKFGTPYPVPRVIFWNLEGDTGDFPVKCKTVGVDMVSGFSPSLLKLFMEDKLEDAMTQMDLDAPGNAKGGPYVTLRKALDDPRYFPVRRICAQVAEGALRGYVAPVEEEEEEEEEEEDEAEETQFLMV
jgi:hypothetical protein